MFRAMMWEVCLLLPGLAGWGQILNVRVSPPTSTNPEEVVVAINPQNPRNLVAGANLNYFYYSTDAGGTWTQGRLTSSLGVAGDPCVVFDALGNAYYGHLSNPAGGSWLDRIVVQKSTDGGQTWNDGVGIGLNGTKDQDKEWLVADMTNSPHRNSLYCAWTEFDSYGSPSPADSTRILFSRSTDAGFSWSPPVRVSDQGGNCLDMDSTVEGAVPAVGPDGEVYLAWSGPPGILFDRSTDGGVTWGKDVFVSAQPGGWDFSIPGIYRSNGMPITACDVSSSPYRGRIYILWSDQREGADNTDVWILHSTDGGATWTGLVKVNNDSTVSHQFFPWLTVDQGTGTLYAAFYDRRNTGSVLTDVSVARSTDGGSTFTNFSVSASSFYPTSRIFFGDYIGIAALDKKVYPIWMGLDTTRLSVWTAPFVDTLTTGVPVAEELPGQYTLRCFPNPFNPSTTLRVDVPAGGPGKAGRVRIRLSIHDLLGQEVTRLAEGEFPPGRHEFVFDASRAHGTTSGVYFARLEANGHVWTTRLVLVK